MLKYQVDFPTELFFFFLTPSVPLDEYDFRRLRRRMKWAFLWKVNQPQGVENYTVKSHVAHVYQGSLQSFI